MAAGGDPIVRLAERVVGKMGVDARPAGLQTAVGALNGRAAVIVYLTKVWGFGEPVGPLQFSIPGFRDSARERLQPGDLVVLVGTKGKPTKVEDQGRLLGLMEPSTEPVRSLHFDLKPLPEDYNEDGTYKWPYALLNRRAWWITGTPVLLNDISDRGFQMDSALGIVPLTPDEAEAVLALPRVEAQLLQPTLHAQERLGGDRAARHSSPPPIFNRRSIMQMRDRPASTYAMEIVGASRSAFKVGWAFDYGRRQRSFNQAAMPELGGLTYRSLLHQPWDSARQAFAMEQRVLKRFDADRHRANHEIIVGVTKDDLESAWALLIRSRPV